MGNRSSFKSNVTTKNVPTVTNAILIDILNNDLADSIVFGEDVAVIQNSGVSNITVDFTGKDRIDLTRTGGSLNITVSGMGDGEVKTLLITKTAGQSITWVGVTDTTPIRANVTAESRVLYEIVRKSSYYYCRAWLETVKTATDTIEGVLEIATAAEVNALTAVDKIVTPGRIPLATTSQKGISELATLTEANALTDATRTITPATIPQATDTQKGVARAATAAENDAGTAGFIFVIASELKRKYDALVALITGSSEMTVNVLTNPNVTINVLRCNKQNNVQALTGDFTFNSTAGVEYNIGTIVGYTSPGYDIEFSINPKENANEQGWGRIRTNGTISVTPNNNGLTFVFNAVAIGV